MAEKKTPAPKAAKVAGKAPATSKRKPGTEKKPASGGKKTGADATNYTQPELRQRLKDEIQAGEKGGRAGQWSARKAQLLAAEYEKHGGGYKKAARTAGQKHLESWTEEKWRTADGKAAAHGKTTSRYLPDKAWDELTPAQRKATDEKKKTASRTGQQFVPNTPAAKRARKSTAS